MRSAGVDGARERDLRGSVPEPALQERRVQEPSIGQAQAEQRVSLLFNEVR